MLVVVYTPKDAQVTPTNSSNFVPCPHCYGYYERKQLWKHSKYECPLNTPNNDSEKDVLVKGSYLLPIPKYVRGQTRQVLSHMHRDEIFMASVYDTLIMRFAEKLIAKHVADSLWHKHVRCKVRILGRLVTVTHLL